MKIGDLFLDLHVDTAQFKKSMGEMGTMAAGAVGILGTAIAGVGLKAAIEWESAFAGVRKTVDATEGELSVLSDTLREMAGELGTPVETLAGLAEAAGALGIKVPDIAEFTRTAAMLGVTTDVSADQAATALGKINAVIPLSREEFGQFASTLVDLGNKGASTESQIIDMAQNMAGAASVMGMGVPQMLGWAAAAANVGIEAEAGASSFQRFGLGVQKFVVDGGPKLEEIARLTGMTKEAFAELWGTDSSEALRRIIAGLAEMDGQTRQATIAALGFTEIRLGKYLMTLSANQDNLNDSLRVGQEAWHENAAMGVEFAKRAKTVEFQLGQMRAELHDIAITIGEALLPHLRSFVGLAREVISGIQGWMRENKGLADNLIQIGTLLSGILALKWGAKFIGALLGQFGIGTLGAALTRAVLPSATLAGGKGGEAMGLSFGEAFIKYALIAAPLLALSHAAQEVTKHIAPAAVAVQDFTLVMGRNAYALRQLSTETGKSFEELQGKFAQFLREGMDPAAALAAAQAWARGIKQGLPKPGDPNFIGPVEAAGVELQTTLSRIQRRAHTDYVGIAQEGSRAMAIAVASYKEAAQRAADAFRDVPAAIREHLRKAREGVAWEGAETPAAYSQALRSRFDTVRSAFNDLKELIKNALSPTKKIAELEGIATSEALAKGLNDARPEVRAQAQQVGFDTLRELAKLKPGSAEIGRLSMRLLAAATASERPAILAEIRAIRAGALRELAGLSGIMAREGYLIGRALGDGLARSGSYVRSKAGYVAAQVRNGLEIHSPAKWGPWQDWDPIANMFKTGVRIGGSLAAGLGRSIGSVRSATSGLAAAAVPNIGMAALSGMGSGNLHQTIRHEIDMTPQTVEALRAAGYNDDALQAALGRWLSTAESGSSLRWND